MQSAILFVAQVFDTGQAPAAGRRQAGFGGDVIHHDWQGLKHYLMRV
jgi:hypothetical protein